MTTEEIAKLDVFEGYPDWYNRVAVDLHSLHGDEDVNQGVVYEMVKPEMLTQFYEPSPAYLEACSKTLMASRYL